MQAELNFAVNRGEPLVVYPSEGGGRVESKSGEYEDRMVTIHDGRNNKEAFDLDVQGFLLTRYLTEVSDFYDDDQLHPTYDQEIQALVRSITGAAEVIVFDHTRRSDDPGIRDQHKIREPAATAHNDYTESSAPQRIRDLLSPQETRRWLGGRFAIINVWRPIVGPVLRSPLVFCDARTIDDADLVLTQRRARDRVGEIYQLAFNGAQRWVLFPSMQSHEVLVFKCFDSATDGRGRFAPHAALRNPGGTDSAPPRQSIETRTIARFPDTNGLSP